MNKIEILIVVISVIAFAPAVMAQEHPDTNYAIYDGRACLIVLKAPDNWVLSLEDAQIDGLSAAFFPEENDYFETDMMIKAWIYQRDSLSFGQFISLDSSNYLKADKSAEFYTSDSIQINDSLQIIVLKFDDPGGSSPLAEVAYINAISEIVIYELNVRHREKYARASADFYEALRKFSISVKD